MKKSILTICVSMALIFCIQTGLSFGFSFGGKFKDVESIDGIIAIPLSEVTDGKAHYFRLTHSGREIRFFVVKSSDDVVRAAFDACDVCYESRKGYSQDGDFMICNNCGRRFHSTRINVVEGGCNPAPLTRKVKGDKLVILTQDVLTGSYLF